MMNDLISAYKNLINHRLPGTYQTPVRFNHCFNRIVLDWLFQDCWYYYLNKKNTAISQLTEHQLQQAIHRMNTWLNNHELLVADNVNSLGYRNKMKNSIR